MSVSRVRGCGEQKGFIEVLRATTDEVTLMPKIRVEIAVNEDFVEPTINAIIKGARTKELGDGKIVRLFAESANLPICQSANLPMVRQRLSSSRCLFSRSHWRARS